jgi:Uncharacterized conserved protein
MVKIAVASEYDMVTEHFGHCQNFNVFEAEDKQILHTGSVPNPGHKPGFLPSYLHDLGVNVIISGGMGAGAIDIFNEKGIEVIVGARGNARIAAEQYLQGILKSTGSVCHEHQHHDGMPFLNLQKGTDMKAAADKMINASAADNGQRCGQLRPYNR